MENNFHNQYYTKLVNQDIETERAMEATRNISVFIIAGMMYFIFGFPQSSHLIAIIGSLTVFLLQIFESSNLLKHVFLERKIKSIEKSNIHLKEVKSEMQILSINEEVDLKGINWLYAFAGTTYKSYILIFLTLDVCWFAKLYLFPYPAASFHEFLGRPEAGFIPGWFFYVFAALFWLTYFSLAIWYKTKSKSVNES